MKLIIYKSRSTNPKQVWRWKVVAANGKKIANAGEGFFTRAGCVASVLKVVAFMQTQNY